MTQEEKQLLLKDLCARLPYGVKVDILDNTFGKEFSLVDLVPDDISEFDNMIIKPYLRPMSSMTMKEQREYLNISSEMSPDNPSVLADWCNANHFDYRHLIEKGLALEAPEDIYNFN